MLPGASYAFILQSESAGIAATIDAMTSGNSTALEIDAEGNVADVSGSPANGSPVVRLTCL